jgi:hypothetical protein
MAASKKVETFLGKLAIVAGTQQALSNLFLSFDIYVCDSSQ